jgi:hypothetical protein
MQDIYLPIVSNSRRPGAHLTQHNVHNGFPKTTDCKVAHRSLFRTGKPAWYCGTGSRPMAGTLLPRVAEKLD